MLTHILTTSKKINFEKEKKERFPKNKINMKLIKYDTQPFKMYDTLNSWRHQIDLTPSNLQYFPKQYLLTNLIKLSYMTSKAYMSWCLVIRNIGEYWNLAFNTTTNPLTIFEKTPSNIALKTC
jgi:hypothetical protein